MMTVLTSTDPEKVIPPEPVLNERRFQFPQVHLTPAVERISKWKTFWRLVSVAVTTLCVLVLSLVVGMACGQLYKHYITSQQRYCSRLMSFGCSATFPLEENKNPMLPNDAPYSKRLRLLGRRVASFKEDFELDLDSRRYEMITVPYKGQRSATFVYDFEANMSAIVDLDNRRCFLMPLDSCHVLCPDQMFDIIHKSMHGCDMFDFDVVKHVMRVQIPAIPKRRQMSCYITELCYGRPIYRLHKWKQPITPKIIPEEGKFAVFAGSGIMHYEIGNYKTLARYESVDLD